jgi:O-antigen/teichoic acid export membrane protein
VCTGWLMPMGRDKAVSWVIAIGAGVNLVLAPMMVKNFGASGMAVTVVIAETVIAIGAIVALRIGRPAPALQIIDGKDMSI